MGTRTIYIDGTANTTPVVRSWSFRSLVIITHKFTFTSNAAASELYYLESLLKDRFKRSVKLAKCVKRLFFVPGITEPD
jgi:hypothetical protein